MAAIYSILLIASVLNYFKIIEGWVDPLVHQITSELEPYQITIFTNGKINSVWDCERFKGQRIAADIPTLVVDLEQLKSSSKENLMNLPAIRHPRKVSLHVIIHRVVTAENDSSKQLLFDFFDFFVKASDIPRRPKCLMIILADNLAKSEELFKNITSYAWTKKFLDLTILALDIITLDSRPILFNYNPFKNTYDKHLWDPNETLLFPDKLRDMHNYTLRTAVFNYPPYLNIYSDNNSSRPKMDGIHYPLMPILSSHFNFTMLSIGEIDTRRTLTSMNTIYNLISTGLINLLPIPSGVETFYTLGGLELGSFFGCSDVAIIVPLHRENHIEVSSQIYLPILFAAIFIFLLDGVARLLRFDRRSWRRDYIVRTLFNFSRPKVPKRLAERLLFVAVSSMAMQHSSNFLMELLNVRIVRKPPTLDNFRDIQLSQIPIFVDEVLEQILFSYDNEDDIVRFIHREANKQPNMINCVNRLENNVSAICLTDLYHAMFLARNMGDRTVVLKIANPTFYCRPLACTFERGSPYVEKFSEVVQRVTESGIQSMWKYMKELETKFTRARYELKEDTEGSMLLAILLVCLGTGFVTAGLILLRELLCKPRVQTRKRAFGVRRVTFEI